MQFVSSKTRYAKVTKLRSIEGNKALWYRPNRAYGLFLMCMKNLKFCDLFPKPWFSIFLFLLRILAGPKILEDAWHVRFLQAQDFKYKKLAPFLTLIHIFNRFHAQLRTSLVVFDTMEVENDCYTVGTKMKWISRKMAKAILTESKISTDSLLIDGYQREKPLANETRKRPAQLCHCTVIFSKTAPVRTDVQSHSVLYAHGKRWRGRAI